MLGSLQRCLEWGDIVELEAREEELRALADEHGVDWKGPLSGLPDDRRVRIVALATLLRIDPTEALRVGGPVKGIAAEARERQHASEEYERKEQEFLHSLNLELGEGA